MKQRFVFFACLAGNMLLFAGAIAQLKSADSSLYRLAVENTTAKYFQSIRESAPFYNGNEFVGYGPNFINHEFFGIDSLKKGDLYYDGTLYEGINMLYDLVSDEVIIKDYTNSYLIRLNSSRIKYFTLQGHVFVNAGKDSSGSMSNETGFYDRLYGGPSTVIAKRKKQIEHSINSERSVSRFEQYNTYYIKKSEEYSRVGSKQSVISLFSDKKNEIKKFIAAQDLAYKKDPELFIIRIAEYYDSLKK